MRLFIVNSTYYLCASLFVTMAMFCGAAFFVARNSSLLVDFSALERLTSVKGTVVLDDEGNELCLFSADKRMPVDIANIPKIVIDAFIATEDRAFWQHNGVSLKGIIRSTIINVYHRRMVQGASTITQQLVRLLFFDARKTWWRKVKEQIYSCLVEKECTKQFILQMYLNNVYFGSGIYGVEAACQRFWAKSVADISIDEAAVLAGIVKSPARYCPLHNKDAAQFRRNVVLLLMKNQGYISTQEYYDAKNVLLWVQENNNSAACSLYVREYLRMQLEKIVGKERLYASGLVVQSTVNNSMQKQAEVVFAKHIQGLKSRYSPDIEGGLLCIEGVSGAIKAMVGGSDFSRSQFNRVTAVRQLGSVFKPLIYAAALMHGIKFTDTHIDEPLSLATPTGHWEPHNYDNTFKGQMTLAHALAHSNNIVTLKTLLSIDIESVIRLAYACGVGHSLKPYPSLALGCVDGTLAEVTGMFNIFAQHGNYVLPYSIAWIKDRSGSKIWAHAGEVKEIIPSIVSDQVARVLSLGFQRLRRRFNDTFVPEAVVKTGTTNDCRTCWFAGATPTYTTALYIGLDNNSSLGKDVYPAQTAFPIWYDFNQAIAHRTNHFSVNQHLREITVHEFSGQLCSKGMPNAYTLLVP